MGDAPASAQAARPEPGSVPSAELGMTVLQRGWLSANQVVFPRHGEVPATLVDTGFCAHAAQTLALVGRSLGRDPLERILNTHLHSDHCGGNAALQAAYAVSTWIPEPSLPAVRDWADDALSYRFTDQPCPRFRADAALVPGHVITLGPAAWQIHAAPGHDMDAIMLFEPQSRTLISGDALWEDRLAIIFPELVGADGFGATRATLDGIERLKPRQVVPGHGQPFDDVAAALAASRQRIGAFERAPQRHADHAARALLMFHLLEVRRASVQVLVEWMLATPVYALISRCAGVTPARRAEWARTHVLRLVDEGTLQAHDDLVGVAAGAG